MSNFLFYVVFPFLCLLSIMLEVQREPVLRHMEQMFHLVQIPALGPHSASPCEQERAKGCPVLLPFSRGEETLPGTPTQRTGTAIPYQQPAKTPWVQLRRDRDTTGEDGGNSTLEQG